MNNENYMAINGLARLRDRLDPIVSGMITRGCACTAKGDLSLEPGKRKTRLADAKTICGYAQHEINRIISKLEENPAPGQVTRSGMRSKCEKCNTLTNWIIQTSGRSAYWCGCD